MPTLIIPCYNKADRLDQTSFVEFSRQNSDTGFLFVNVGKAEAVRAGGGRIPENPRSGSPTSSGSRMNSI
jgi:hypothetical protein